MELAGAESIGLGAPAEAGSLAEAALIRAAQRRDPDAFEQLVRLHERNVLRLAMNLMRSPEDARDAYQEAFLKVYRKLDTFRFDCAFSTWLYRIATNACLDLMRRKGARKEYTVGERDDDAAPNPLSLAADARADADPGRSLEGRRLSARIEAALGELTAQERTVFELRHFEGLRLRAIGETIGVSEEAAKNSLFRATRKLRAALGGEREG